MTISQKKGRSPQAAQRRSQRLRELRERIEDPEREGRDADHGTRELDAGGQRQELANPTSVDDRDCATGGTDLRPVMMTRMLGGADGGFEPDLDDEGRNARKRTAITLRASRGRNRFTPFWSKPHGLSQNGYGSPTAAFVLTAKAAPMHAS